jgi:hypothetical protein
MVREKIIFLKIYSLKEKKLGRKGTTRVSGLPFSKESACEIVFVHWCLNRTYLSFNNKAPGDKETGNPLGFLVQDFLKLEFPFIGTRT